MAARFMYQFAHMLTDVSHLCLPWTHSVQDSQSWNCRSCSGVQPSDAVLLQGFAYVDFDTDDAVQQASQKDGEVVNGRTLFIAKSQPPGGAGRGRGRGRFERGGGGGRGHTAAPSERDSGGWGGRGGDRGRGSGRGRPGLGFAAKADIPVANAHTGHQRPHLETGAEAAKPPPQLVPRALISKQQGSQHQQQRGTTGMDAQPKSNEDFRKILLKK